MNKKNSITIESCHSIFVAEDKYQAALYTRSVNLLTALMETSELLRKKIKYNPENLNRSQIDAIEKFRNEFLGVLEENNVNLEELVY